MRNEQYKEGLIVK